MKFSDISGRLYGLEGRLLEDELYQIVWEEIERNEMDPVAQARSVEEGGELDAKVRAAYIKHRLRRLNDQLKVEELVAKETIRQEQEDISRKEAEQKRRLAHCKVCDIKFSFFNKNHSGICRSCAYKFLGKNF
jgi:uncharacterized Fe-S radical SAM superfamily protein PflX